MNLGLAVQASGEDTLFAVRVAPRASRTAITGTMGEGADTIVKIALAAPPVDGRANEALIAYLAEILDITRGDIVIASGAQSKNKRVRIKGCGAEQVRLRLEAAVA